jgi:hypothetical protein
MTEHSATIAITDPSLAGYEAARAATTAELASPPHAPDDPLNATTATP